MTNTQVRLIASALAMIGGGLAAGANIGIGVAIIVVSAALFLAEWIRMEMKRREE